MDEFGTLTESFGIKPQGKSAPMAASRRPTNPNTTGTPNFGFVSGVDAAKQHRNSNSGGGSFLGDPDVLFRSSGNQKTQNYGNSDGFGDIFGGPIKNSKQSNGPSFDYDSIFNNFSDSSTKSSLSVHDKLVYDDDDDIFGVSALKSSAPAKNNNVFGSFASSSNQTAPIDDLLGNFGRMQSESNILGRNGSGNVEENVNGFDDLIPGFGGSSPPKNGVNLETSGSQQSSVHSR
ncbi:hypothetical protein L1049_026794 [Liquidambar formosana]|uniref:Uncharacterized protein n=1 Tax=Liquidambar formosana TaxID=63359 RepID=A0AAP0NHP4_LIQFO